MAYTIIYKKRFTNKLIKILNYLEENWSLKIASDFLQRIDNEIELLKTNPEIGSRSSKIPKARGILITKHNRLIYKVEKHSIVILNIYDTRSRS